MKIFTPDPDDVDVPGSGLFKFTNKARWWFLWKYAKEHDDAYEALGRLEVPGGWQQVCSCGAAGPHAVTKEDATRAWNERR